MEPMIDALGDIEAALEDLSDFVDLCRRGMRFPDQARAVLEIANTRLGIKKGKAAKLRSAIKKIGEVSDRAHKHIEAGFPYLFGLATVQLWTILDATMTDFIIEFMTHRDLWKRARLTGSVRVKVADFVGRSQREQIEIRLGPRDG